MKISRILHAGYVFECEQTQIAFDPILENPFSRNCHAFPQVKFDHEQIRNQKFAAVFISHFHDDHCSLESLDLLDRNTPIYLYCLFEELFSLIKELGFLNVYSLQLDTAVLVGPFEVIPRRALDADVDSMFQVRAAGLNVLNVVDSWIDESTISRLSLESPWDMILWPFQTMLETDVIAPTRAFSATSELPHEWIGQLQALNPRYIVPSSCQFVQESWSWYNHALFPISYRQFKQEIEEALPNSKVVRMNPSVSVMLDKESLKVATPLPWVQPMGDQDVDYNYKPNLKPPTTAQIAKNFAPLSSEQTQRIFEYCKTDLLLKYRSMDPPLDDYFHKPRTWCLSVYDHEGQRTDFHYRVMGNNIESAIATDSLSWLTEVPVSKFYAALEYGESLTSMYMRINDRVFAPDIEKEIQLADIVEDPLIRCLFTGAICAYQKAQLKRLQDLKTTHHDQ